MLFLSLLLLFGTTQAFFDENCCCGCADPCPLTIPAKCGAAPTTSCAAKNKFSSNELVSPCELIIKVYTLTKGQPEARKKFGDERSPLLLDDEVEKMMRDADAADSAFVPIDKDDSKKSSTTATKTDKKEEHSSSSKKESTTGDDEVDRFFTTTSIFGRNGPFGIDFGTPFSGGLKLLNDGTDTIINTGRAVVGTIGAPFGIDSPMPFGIGGGAGTIVSDTTKTENGTTFRTVVRKLPNGGESTMKTAVKITRHNLTDSEKEAIRKSFEGIGSGIGKMGEGMKNLNDQLFSGLGNMFSGLFSGIGGMVAAMA